MENFVFPDNFQGMLIFVKWHESKKENVILSQFCMGTKLLSVLGSALHGFGVKSEQRVGGIFC